MTAGIETASGVRLELSPRTTRFIGQMIDGCIGAIPFVLATMFSALFIGLGVVIAVLGVAWAAFYYLFADGLHGGQSLAKQWLGMRVVNAKTGEPCTFGQSFIRNFLLAACGPLDWIFIFGEQHQRLGDKAAGTIVIVAD